MFGIEMVRPYLCAIDASKRGSSNFSISETVIGACFMWETLFEDCRAEPIVRMKWLNLMII